MKTAIVTGGTKGIGKQIVIDLLKRGYYVYVNYANDTQAAKEAEKVFKKQSDAFKVAKSDQGDDKEFSAFTKMIMNEAEEINCIVCNAGATLRKPTMEIENGEWEKIMRIILNSHFYLIRDVYPLIKENSRIVMIGSMMGVMPHGTSLPYGVAKAALHAMAKNMVKDFEGTGTTVNVIAPGFVETEWQKNKPQEIRENINKKTAIHRFATPEEISSAVMFCIDNAFVNGSMLEISGGYCYK